MKKANTTWHIRFVFLAMMSGLVFAWTANIAHADTASPQISIASTGQVIVRDAKVVYTSGNTITARSSWGAMEIAWTVITSGSTRFVPDADSSLAIKSIKAGDLIDFSGEIDSSSGFATVHARVVKDNALQKEAVTQTGTVLAIDTAGRTFTMEYAGATTTVVLTRGTIMTRDGNEAALGELTVGDTIKVIGSLNTITRTLKAERAGWKSATQTVVGPPGGIFSGLVGWLEGSRGLFSVR